MANPLTPTPNGDIRHEAAGNLAFMLSVIRCGEQLSAGEEENVRRVIRELGAASVSKGVIAKKIISELEKYSAIPHEVLDCGRENVESIIEACL